MLKILFNVFFYNINSISLCCSKWVGEWVSIEHDRWWGARVRRVLEEDGLGARVTLHIVPNNLPFRWLWLLLLLLLLLLFTTSMQAGDRGRDGGPVPLLH